MQLFLKFRRTNNESVILIKHLSVILSSRGSEDWCPSLGLSVHFLVCQCAQLFLKFRRSSRGSEMVTRLSGEVSVGTTWCVLIKLGSQLQSRLTNEHKVI